ncbi:MAG: Zn-dependent exopeptidase M28 [Thermoleophilia bacterium]|nr:Zn-dependent exopeptidase M28 [Thermoleophilia bacterium]
MRIAAGAVAYAASPIAAPTAAPVPARRVQGATEQEQLLIDRMSASNTIKHIAELNKAPRVWKTDGYERGLEYVMSQLQEAGWDVHVEELQSSGWMRGKLRNIVAERRGTAADGERQLVVAGAHLDSVRGAPGANDNASGSSTLIELARSFNGIDTRNDIRLVWFDGEEAGLLGSRAHVKEHRSDADRTIAMINMDMVGSQFGKVAFDLGRRTGNAIADALKGVALRTRLEVTQYDERHSRSDHASFDDYDIPALDFGVSVRAVNQQDPNYHSPRDTVDKINSQVLEGNGDLIAVMLLDAANRASRY